MDYIMIINSQFFITYYSGNQRLSLKTVPENLTDEGRAEYDRFIQSISAIYSSQSANGKIPKFWTKLVEGSDSLGNKRYLYAPHPDSDLEFLDPRSSYYFIVRDESAIPLKIPAIGGSLLGFTSTATKVLPNVVPESIVNSTLSLADGNSLVINPRIENLQPYEEYRYEFKSVDSNWPVSVNAISGILKPSTPTGIINARVTFCPTSGSCDNNTLNYTIPQPCLFTKDSDKYATMQLSITPISYTGPETISNQFTIGCKDCLPKPSISLASSVPNIINKPTDSTVNASYEFSVSINNLLKNQIYSYRIETINSQWPIIFIGPSSGTIDVKSITTIPQISSKILFCQSTGICQPGQNGVNNYSVPSYPKFWTGPIDYDIMLRASLISSSCPSDITYSNPLVVTYRKPALSSNGAGGPGAKLTIDDGQPDPKPPSSVPSLIDAVVDLVPASDSGSSNTDNITNVVSPVVTLSIPNTINLLNTDTIEILVNNSVVTTVPAEPDLLGGYNVAIPEDAVKNDGQYTISARIKNSAGDVGIASAALGIVIDRTPPGAAPSSP
jgi:hypothetical protein